MAEWKPVVGGRAMLHGEPCLVMALTSDARAEVGRVGWGLRPLVPLSDLTEHPDDARHRRLLEAARRVRVAEAALSRATEHPDWDGLAEAVSESQSALAALYAIIDEANHAS